MNYRFPVGTRYLLLARTPCSEYANDMCVNLFALVDHKGSKSAGCFITIKGNLVQLEFFHDHPLLS